MRDAQVWLYKRKPTTKLFLQTLVTAVSVYLTALLGAEVSQVRNLGGLSRLGFHFVAVLIPVTIVVSLVRLLTSAVELELRRREQVLSVAHSQLDDALAQELKRFAAASARGQFDSLVPHDPQASLEELVGGFYSCLNSQYASSEVPGERVNFEVTLMARDYDDGEITILAWASRDGRKPRSLSERERRPDIYNATVTAQVYRESEHQLPRMRVVEDTSNGEYVALYAGQKDRIKSSIIFPVLSANNVLLGTLVAHCDQPGFFSQTQEKYWRELCEIFAMRAALEKSRLDWLHEEERSGRATR